MAEQKFFSMLTPYGRTVALNVFNGGQPVQLTQMAVGFGTEDTGNGGYTPTEGQEDLFNEWLRFDLNSLKVDPENSAAWLIAEGIIREDIGGHWIHEVSIIDNTGGVVAICAWPPTYKPTLPEGSSSASVIRCVIEVSDTNNFVLVIDTSLALVTRDEFQNEVEKLAPIDSPEFIGVPTAPTPELTDDSTKIATTEYVRAAASQIEEWVTENFSPGGGDGGDGGDGGNGGEPPITSGNIYGARWFKNNSPTTLTRIHDAVGLNFTPAVNGVGGSSDFDNMPIYRDIRLCNVVNGAVTAYQGEPGFSRTPASGDVMVEIPKFYYKVVEGQDTRDYLISDTQHDNTWKVSPRHAAIGGQPERDKIYVSAYTLNSNYRSVSGNQSLVSITRAQARAGCSGRGAQYWQYDYATYCTIQLLYLVEVADWYSQAAVGQGYVSSSNTAQINTGNSDGITFHSGATVAAGVQTGTVKYRHMENLWGNLYQWVDGININDRQAYISTEPSQYADDTADNYTALSYVNFAGANGFIKRLGFDPNIPWAQICVEGDGADGTFIPDRYYSNTGWRVLRVGGYWNTTYYAGLFLFNGNNESASDHTSVGCRLLILP